MPETLSFLLAVGFITALLFVKSTFQHRIFGRDLRPMTADVAAFLIVPVYTINSHLHHYNDEMRYLHSTLIFVTILLVLFLWYRSNRHQQKSELEQIDHLLAFSLKGSQGEYKTELSKKISDLPLDRVLKHHTNDRGSSYPFFDYVSNLVNDRYVDWRSTQLTDRITERHHLTGHCVGFKGDDPAEWLSDDKPSWISQKLMFSALITMLILLVLYMLLMMNGAPTAPATTGALQNTPSP